MINAVDLRQRGIQAIREELAMNEEGIISYKGRPAYVVIPYEKYDRLRALELDAAFEEVMRNIQKGHYEKLNSAEAIDAHVESLKS